MVDMVTVGGRWARWAVVGMVLLWLVGCATSSPRYVEAVDSSGERVKFLYQEQQPDGQLERGVIECDLVDDQFEDCRRVEVEYQ